MKRIKANAFTSLASLLLSCIASVLSSARAADTVLHHFVDGIAEGNVPTGSLTLSDSKLYGMTNGFGFGVGGIFSINADGSGYSLLHTFIGGNNDGFDPYGSLTLSGSKLYGMTSGGGSSGAGTIFSINTDGSNFNLLRSFAGADGGNPSGSLTFSGSKLYGMTAETIFSINTDGSNFSLLHSFTGGSGEGSNARGSLTLSGSKLYGMTVGGGANGQGTIFSVGTDGSGFDQLHAFAGGPADGTNPFGSLTLFGSKLYGTTLFGGASNGGTIFNVNTDGTGFNVLHSFAGGLVDGNEPEGSLTLFGSKLYGMTTFGGVTDNGTVFSISPDGSDYTLLHSFAGEPVDGGIPLFGDVSISADGQTLYGMTAGGGVGNVGVIFSMPTGIVPEPTACFAVISGIVPLFVRRRRS